MARKKKDKKMMLTMEIEDLKIVLKPEILRNRELEKEVRAINKQLHDVLKTLKRVGIIVY